MAERKKDHLLSEVVTIMAESRAVRRIKRWSDENPHEEIPAALVADWYAEEIRDASEAIMGFIETYTGVPRQVAREAANDGQK